MQTVIDPTEVLAFAISDIHLSDKKPRVRGEKPEEWFATMDRYFDHLYSILSHYDFKERQTPLLIAGDIFDYFDPSPELVNFAIKVLKRFPIIYAIPGQHDLPFHRLADLKKSGYWTLHEAGVIKDLAHPLLLSKNNCCAVHHYNYKNKVEKVLRIAPFPWERNQVCDLDRLKNGKDWVFNKESNKHSLPIYNLALIHRYLWCGQCYDGASHDDNYEPALKPFSDAGFHYTVSGDNHLPWGIHWPQQNFQAVNCGTFMRRKKDEIDTEPGVCVIGTKGIGKHLLDIRDDKFYIPESAGLSEDNQKIKELVESLSKTVDAHDDFIKQLLETANLHHTAVSQKLKSIVEELENAHTGSI